MFLSDYFRPFNVLTAEILARSLADFHCQYEFIIQEFIIYAIHQQARADNLRICYRKKTN